MSHARLSSSEKKLIIDRALKGESVTALATETKVSRTIIYRWLKQYISSQRRENDPLTAKNPKGRKHWRKLKNATEDKVIRVWRDNPEYSMRRIATLAGVSIGSVWNIIKAYKIKAEKTGKKVKRYKKKRYKSLSPQDKIQLISRYHSGESIAKIAREMGVSRTIFYRWLASYEKGEKREEVFEKLRPKGAAHWRFMPAIRTTLLDVIAKNPKVSLSQLLEKLSAKGQYVSKSGLYYMLKRMQLDTYERRLAFATSVHTLATEPQHAPFDYSLPALVTFILIMAALFMFNMAVRIGNPFTDIVIPTHEIGRTPPKANEGQNPPPGHTEQNFGWGALSMDTPKDRYTTGEPIPMGFSIVDHKGTTVCNGQIDVLVFSPSGQKILETDGGESAVKPSGTCSVQGIGTKPDYVVTLPGVYEEGNYSLQIKATTYEGEKDFSQQFLVRNAPTIEVKRYAYPSRVFPHAVYPVEISIKPQQDFRGTITEEVPHGVTASDISGAGRFLASGSGHKITWDVVLRKGQSYKLTYTLHFPIAWPKFYEIGPMKFVDEAGKLVYREARYWQVVADP